MSTKVKSSNKFLNILIIAVGLLFIFQAIIMILTLFNVIIPTGWLATLVSTVGGSFALGSNSLLFAVIGLWCLISGVGLFKDAEWAMGQALVVLSIIVATTVVTAVGIILELINDPNSFYLNMWTNILTLVSFIIGIVGFIWLFATRKRYG